MECSDDTGLGVEDPSHFIFPDRIGQAAYLSFFDGPKVTSCFSLSVTGQEGDRKCFLGLEPSDPIDLFQYFRKGYVFHTPKIDLKRQIETTMI